MLLDAREVIFFILFFPRLLSHRSRLTFLCYNLSILQFGGATESLAAPPSVSCAKTGVILA